MIRGIQPKDKTDSRVPQTINAATKMFFNVDNGMWENIVASERNRIAQDIQIILTDDRKAPNVAIYLAFDIFESPTGITFPISL